MGAQLAAVGVAAAAAPVDAAAVGPTAMPAEAAALQIPMARLRSRGSWKRLRISARVEGINVAPATPSSARAAIIIPGVCA